MVDVTESPLSKGFLITVPMREEWETEAGIKVLDGWNFQVNAVATFCPKVTDSLPQFSSE